MRNEVALSYHRVRGLYFVAVVFVATINSVVIFAACIWRSAPLKVNHSVLAIYIFTYPYFYSESTCLDSESIFTKLIFVYIMHLYALIMHLCLHSAPMFT